MLSRIVPESFGEGVVAPPALGKLRPWRSNYGASVDLVDPSFCFHGDTWWTPLTCLFISGCPRRPLQPEAHLSFMGKATIPLSICLGWKADAQQVLADTANGPFCATQMGGALLRGLLVGTMSVVG